MRDSVAAHFIGLDIGTSNIRCVVGMIDQENPSELSIIGHGSAKNSGMRKGVVVHINDVVESLVQAIAEAERISGVQINGASVNINGAHITGQNSKGVVAISSANREISTDDRYRAEEAAAILQIPPNREIIQVFAKNYRVDGQDNIKDPIGMHGVRLEVDTHIVTAATPNVKNLSTVLERANMRANHITVSSLAAAEAVLTRQQKESGCLLMDIGAGTTNMVVVEDGEIQYIGVLPVGGINITNDLAIGLKTDLDIAEEVKLKHATLLPPKTDNVSIEHEGKTHSFQTDEILMITEARVEELLEMVDKELRKIGKSRKLPGGIIITGGTANLPGLAEFARDKLQLAARIGKLQPLNGLVDIVENPSFVTAIGLMQLDMLLSPNVEPHTRGLPNKKVMNMIQGIVRRIKP